MTPGLGAPFSDAGRRGSRPKRVIGELEFELGAVFRNPREAPLLFTDPRTIERRLLLFADALPLDRTRIPGGHSRRPCCPSS